MYRLIVLRLRYRSLYRKRCVSLNLNLIVGNILLILALTFKREDAVISDMLNRKQKVLPLSEYLKIDEIEKKKTSNHNSKNKNKNIYDQNKFRFGKLFRIENEIRDSVTVSPGT